MSNLPFDQSALDEVCRQFDLSLVLAYGSQVTGHAGPESDTDVGVLHREGVLPTDKYLDLHYQLSQVFQADKLDLVDLRRVPGLLKHIACEKGRVIYEGNAGVFVYFQLQAWNQYQDERIAIRRYDSEAIQIALGSFAQ